MSDGAFPHQHGDPRGLRERIDAQLRERIEEAVEMAGLELLVALRERHGRPRPEAGSVADRREHEALVDDLLTHLERAFAGEIAASGQASAAAPRTVGEPPAGIAPGRARALASQVLLAKRLPDYWQRFEAHRAAHAQARLSRPVEASGWLRGLFSRSD